MLKEKDIKAIRPREEKYFVSDGDGLSLVVYPTGTMKWILRIRRTIDGKIKNRIITLGTYPAMQLYDARHARDIEKGRVMKAEGKVQLTFHDLAEEWYKVKCVPEVSARYAHSQKTRLEHYVYPKVGDKYPDDIKAADVLSLLRAIEAQGWKDVPHDVCQLIGQIMRYGIITGRCERDVTQDLRGALTTSRAVHYPSVRGAENIGKLMRDIWGMPDGIVKRLLLFTAYTFVRPTEARLAAWDEFDFSKREWIIPEGRMKMRRPHIVPLSDQAMRLVQDIIDLKAYSLYCFPAPRNFAMPLANMSCLVALRKMGYTAGKMTVHGFRSIASTTLYEHQFLGAAIERQLAHSDSNSVRAAYNYAEHLDYRRSMMQWYADYLDALRDGTPVPDKPSILK